MIGDSVNIGYRYRPLLGRDLASLCLTVCKLVYTSSGLQRYAASPGTVGYPEGNGPEKTWNANSVSSPLDKDCAKDDRDNQCPPDCDR